MFAVLVRTVKVSKLFNAYVVYCVQLGMVIDWSVELEIKSMRTIDFPIPIFYVTILFKMNKVSLSFNNVLAI